MRTQISSEHRNFCDYCLDLIGNYFFVLETVTLARGLFPLIVFQRCRLTFLRHVVGESGTKSIK